MNPDLPRPEGGAARLREAEAALADYLAAPGERRADLRPRLEQAEEILKSLVSDPTLSLRHYPVLYLTFIGEELDRYGPYRLDRMNPGKKVMYGFVFANPSRPALDFLRARLAASSDFGLSQVYHQVGGGNFDSARADDDRRFLSLLGPMEGAVAADLGGGLGFLAWELAEAVGPRGRVYLADPDPSLEDFLDYTATVPPWRDLTPRVRFVKTPSSTDPGLPEPVDVLTMQEVHILCDGIYEETGRRLLPRIRESLKPGGRLGIFEGFRRDVTPEKAARRLEAAGFEVRETVRIRARTGFMMTAVRRER